MAQHDYVIANGTGAAVRSDINNGLAAIVTNNSGATEPATMYAYQWWADTTTGLLKIRNAANNGWVTVGTLASANLGLLASAGTLTAALGSASTPGITFTGDTNTGIYSPGADQVAVATGGTVRLSLSTTAISSALPIDYPLGAVGTPSITFTGDLNTGIYSPAADTLAFVEGGVEAMRIDSSGRVGIGTTSPTRDLEVSRAGTAYFRVADTANSVNVDSFATAGLGCIGTASNHPFVVQTFNNERLRVDTSGRLLVGTSTARANFFNSTSTSQVQVEGTNNDTASAALIRSSTDNGGTVLYFAKQRGSIGANGLVSSGDKIATLSFQGSDGTEFVEAAKIEAEVDGTPGTDDMPGRLVFSTTADGASSPTERMRITNNGSAFFGGISVKDASTRSFAIVTTGEASIYCNHGTGDISGDPYLIFNYTGAKIGSITQSGTTAVAYNTSSDYRLKENIVPLTGAADRINQLQVHRFNFISDPDRTVDGFIAHEAQAVVPECVTGTKDEVDADGNPIYQGIDQSKLVPLLTAALQEAIAEITSLKDRLTAAGL